MVPVIRSNSTQCKGSVITSYAMLPHHFYRGDLVAEAALLIISCCGDFYSRKLPQSRCLRVLYKRILV
uniref:Ovule protein n=1 Tax=Ascaris lumbricoides TaxID=6252 RepID=A0A0M3HLD4_ASCLU